MMRASKAEGHPLPKTSLAKIAGWDIKTARTFSKLLAGYASLPNYKQILRTMIDFERMYIPDRRFTTEAVLGGGLKKEFLSIKRAVVYMQRKDLVNTVDTGGKRRLVLTSRAHRVFFEDHPLAKLREKPWQGTWTIVMYDFPEKQRALRTKLRKRLLSLGFGSPQISILVSPLPLSQPIQALIEGERLSPFVWVLTAQRVLGMENGEVAKAAWPVDEINRLYRQLLDALPKVNKNGKKGQEVWKRHYLALSSVDPMLPYELLPKDWFGLRCERAFVRMGPLGILRGIFYHR